MNAQETTIKQAVVGQAKAKAMDMIRDYKTNIDQTQKSAEKDDIDFHNLFESPREQIEEYVNAAADQLNFTYDELAALNRIDVSKPNEVVGFGAVVETNQGNFLVAVGIEDFEVGGVTYHGMSTQAPLYEALQGKKAGDKVSFRDREYVIKAVY